MPLTREEFASLIEVATGVSTTIPATVQPQTLILSRDDVSNVNVIVEDIPDSIGIREYMDYATFQLENVGYTIYDSYIDDQLNVGYHQLVHPSYGLQQIQQIIIAYGRAYSITITASEQVSERLDYDLAQILESFRFIEQQV